MTTLYKIVSDGEDIYFAWSKRNRLMAEYSKEPYYLRNKRIAEIILEEMKKSIWDYQFSNKKEVREHWINKDNIEIVEVEFEEDFE